MSNQFRHADKSDISVIRKCVYNHIRKDLTLWILWGQPAPAVLSTRHAVMTI